MSETVRGDAAGSTAYLAADGYLDVATAELGDVAETYGRLLLAPGPARQCAWAQNIWFDPVRIPIGSIGEGVKALRALQRDWALYDFQLHRRAALIQSQLPKSRARPVKFPEPSPTPRLGSWMLLDANTILAARNCSSPFPNGIVEFVEDRQTPPNRAYLKLWEALTVAGETPGPGQLCLDLGASPGGWSWVLHETGARVIAVDKAALDPRIAALPRMAYRGQSAFALEPAEIGPIDWLCSDIICYPSRLLTLVNKWLASGLVKRFVCTLKFQGPTDHDSARAFAAIPGSRLLHLSHNKHELTWIKLA